MSDEERCFFVQFPHPGGEHNPPTDIMPWNVHDHRRKFLRAQGRYLGHDGHVVSARLVLWGEWEPPSRIVRRWPQDGHLPRALHEPFWTTPEGDEFRQNTDPWIWGENMLYSCCKQTAGDQRSATAMQRLTRGSFCLDTVFVVASAEPWTAVGASELQADDAFIICTAGSIANSPDARVTFTLYRGATFDRPVGSMFSFVPALRADDEAARFPRPSIKLPGLVNPMSRQSTWGSRRPLDVDTVTSAWSAVKDQVVGAGLGLAVSLDIPPREARIQPLQIGTRTRC
jgi:hypothetical protein